MLSGQERDAGLCLRNQCPECKLQLSCRQSLKRHWTTWHTEKTSEQLVAYLDQFDRHGKVHICPTCGKGFSRPNTLKDHQTKLHGEKDLKRMPHFKCPIHQCSTPPFYFSKDLLKHCEESHGDQLGMSIIKIIRIITHTEM